MHRVGLIGPGPRQPTKERGGGFAFGRNHADSWRRLENVELIAACDINRDNLNASCDDYGLAGRYRDVREILTVEKLDIVSICTWPVLHAKMTVAAAEAGVKGIYCETRCASAWPRRGG